MNEKEIKENLGKGKDLRGEKFTRLTPIFPYKERKCRNVVWHCKCDCGNECDVIASHLISNHTRSCGCLNIEAATEVGKNKLIDLTGRKYGKLTVLERDGTYIGKDGRSEPLWKCQCECGNITIVSRTNLNCGNVLSCGCLKQSKGEYIISKILSMNNIYYEQQKTFSNCIFPNTKGLAKFDFYVNNQYLIEFDGEQHFNSRKYGYFTEEKVKEIKYRDEIKNQWCKNNNIPLIRIPYTHLQDLCLEDLKLETTTFLI